MTDLLALLGFGEEGWGSFLLLGTLTTVSLTFCGLLVGAVCGALVAGARLSSGKSLQFLGNTYTTLFRAVPELLVIYLLYFGGSTLVTRIGQWFGAEGFIATPPFLVGTLAVGIISGSYQAEIYRGAYLAVTRGEVEAARSIGMPRLMLVRRILFPQMMRLSLPGLGNVWQMTLKDSALISVIGMAELMRSAQIAAGSTRQYFTFYIVAGAMYLLLTVGSNQIFSKTEYWMGRSMRRHLPAK